MSHLTQEELQPLVRALGGRMGRSAGRFSTPIGEHKYSTGDPHPSIEGFFFLRRNKSDCWGNAQTLSDRRRVARESSKRYYRTPEGNATIRRYKQSDKVREYQRQLRQTPARRAYLKKWDQDNPDKGCARANRRRARKASQLSESHDEKIESVLYEQSVRLHDRLGIKFHVDHIVPLHRGGEHHHTNLKVIPAKFNHAKGPKLNEECSEEQLPLCWR